MTLPQKKYFKRLDDNLNYGTMDLSQLSLKMSPKMTSSASPTFSMQKEMELTQ